MRRVILLIVVALVGAGWYGLAGSTTALAVNGRSVTYSNFNAELTAISTHPGLLCYLSSLAGVGIEPGAGRDTVTAAGDAAWANFRVEGLAIDEYVKQFLHYQPTAADLASATNSLEGELTAAATQASQTCPGTSTAALAEMPAEMRQSQIEAQAASVYLVSKLNSTIPLTAAKIKQYYTSHLSRYDTLCVSVAVVSPTNLTAFAASQKQGMSVAALAKKYSVDTSAASGGVYGCYAPSSSSYTGVRSDVATTALNHFPTTPLSISYNNATYALFVAPTKETVSPFATAEPVVINDIQASNATGANQVKANLLYAAAVVVNPSYGNWGIASSGPAIFAPGLPGDTGPTSKANLTTVATQPYQ
ncbi:MAG TPA: hypothetical protein VIJ86_09670 [Acidimicrobiales bacterium]